MYIYLILKAIKFGQILGIRYTLNNVEIL